VARWFLGANTLSPRVLAVGGRLGYDDDGQTPNTLIAYHDYMAAPLIMEVRGLPEASGSTKMDAYKGQSIGVVVECEGGRIVVPDYSKAIAYDKDSKEIKRFDGTVNHFENFIKAVRSRNERELNAPIREGHLSSALCHTANISYRLGSQAAPDAIREQIKGDRDALPTFERMAEHLAANQVDINSTSLTMGVLLKMNPSNEQFIQSKPANHMLTRQARAPFTIPIS
jgi:hypothetical protein